MNSDCRVFVAGDVWDERDMARFQKMLVLPEQAGDYMAGNSGMNSVRQFADVGFTTSCR